MGAMNRDRGENRKKARNRGAVPVLAAFLLVVVFSLLHPLPLSEPDAWGYYFAARAFSHFSLTIDENTYREWVREAAGRGHRWQGDIGFAPVGEGRYGFIKSPGYAVLLAPFARAGLARWLPFILGFIAVAAAFRACALLLSKETARTAALLMIFSPGFLIMLHRPFMSDFAGFALVTAGASLYLIFQCGQEASRHPERLLLFSAFALAAAVAVRYTNLPIAALFAIHFTVKALKERKHLPLSLTLLRFLCFFLPIMMVFTLLGFYHDAVFGGPGQVGYTFIEHPRNEGINFSHQYLASGRAGEAFASLARNFLVIPKFLILVLPATLLMLPGIYAYRRMDGRYRSLLLLWMAAFWIVYAEYVILQASTYLIIGRMYLPVLLPTALFASAFLHRFRLKERRACLAGLIALGVIFLCAFLALEGTGPFNPGLSGYLEKMKVMVWQGQTPPLADPG